MIFNKNQTSPHWCLTKNSVIHLITSGEAVCLLLLDLEGDGWGWAGLSMILCQLVLGPQCWLLVQVGCRVTTEGEMMGLGCGIGVSAG